MGFRIAFASIDGTRVNQHFASARYWQIYDIDSQAHFVETRKPLYLHQGHCEGGFGPLLTLLSDCHAIFVTRIGQAAAIALMRSGKRVFEASGQINDILDQLIRGNLLKDNNR